MEPTSVCNYKTSRIRLSGAHWGLRSCRARPHARDGPAAGVGKTAALYHATLRLLQTRAWCRCVYLPAAGAAAQPAELSRRLAALLHVPIPPAAPAEYAFARCAHCAALGQAAGLVVDGVAGTAGLQAVAAWAARLQRHAPTLQVVFGVRADAEAVLDGAKMLHLRPLREADSDQVLADAVAQQVRRRLCAPASATTALPADTPSADSSSAATVPAAEIQRSNAEGAVDLSGVVAPALALAREGLRLCRGVPALLRSLAAVALACTLAPAAHGAADGLKANLQARLCYVPGLLLSI